MGLQKAKLVNLTAGEAPSNAIEVLFNPTEYTIERGVTYAEQQTLGTQIPILQFVRGDAQTLNLELFLDKTTSRGSIETDLAQLRNFVKIDEDLHTPPVCGFQWGAEAASGAESGQGRTADDHIFKGVVTSLRERHTLVDEDGRVLRARVTLTLKSYRAAEVQRRESPSSSPDRTRVRVIRERETLSQIAGEVYGDPRMWRLIATENGIDRPMFIEPGTSLRIPSVASSAIR